MFVGHGSPMNAIEDNEFRRGWVEVACAIPRPSAILCISAHWETRGVALTASPQPDTIHDFYGFPKELFAVRYPAPGDPVLASRVQGLVSSAGVALDPSRGLDHGSWSVLFPMYPRADIPVMQLSLDTSRPGSFHFALARELAPLRDEGVLILGSGNIVHNLRLIDFDNPRGYSWADRFNGEVKRRIVAGGALNHGALADYKSLGEDARLAVPTPEHYFPLLYALALQEEGEPLTWFNDRVLAGSASMTSLMIGAASP
jgi:4,5-DOPA dioxygenase extradiol